MSARQFGFAIGVALAVIWAVLGFLVLVAALFAGIVGYVIASAVDGDLRGAFDRLSRSRP